MPDTDLRLTETARTLLRKIGLEELARVAIVCWNPRMRSAAGRAWLLENRIDINPALLEIEDSESEVSRTLRHELAHLVAQYRVGGERIRPHGPEWRHACSELGIPGEKVTHHLELPTQRKRRRLAYRCPSCGTIVERVRKLVRPAACRSCCDEHNEGRFAERFAFVLCDKN